MVVALYNALPAAQTSDAVILAQNLQYHSDLDLYREVSPQPTADTLDNLLGRQLRLRYFGPHLRSLVTAIRTKTLLTSTANRRHRR